MSTKIPDCGVCFTRHISNVSDIWCSECDDGLCLSYKQHHSASKSTRHHVTVPIEEYRKLPVLISEIKEICEKHSETYQMFCKSHDCSCFRKYTIENHKECKDVVLIEDIIQDTKTSVSCDDIQQQLSVISKYIQLIRENRQANTDLIRKQKERIEKDIRYLRETINNHLDELQEQITRELIEIEVKTNNEMQELLTTLQADDQICNLFNNVNSFGKISIETKSSDVNIEAYKQDQAQQRIVSIPVRSVNDVMHTLKQTIKTGYNNVTGCCIMSNGMMVFVKYYSEEVIVLHKVGSMDFTIDIRSGNHVT